jgi:hypothetical protein
MARSHFLLAADDQRAESDFRDQLARDAKRIDDLGRKIGKAKRRHSLAAQIRLAIRMQRP